MSDKTNQLPEPVKGAFDKAANAADAKEAWKWLGIGFATLLATPAFSSAFAQLGASSRTRTRWWATVAIAMVGGGTWFVYWALKNDFREEAKIVLQTGLPSLIAAFAARAGSK